MKLTIVALVGVVLSALGYSLGAKLMGNKLYHDTVLSNSIEIGNANTTLEVDITVEGDVQMVCIKIPKTIELDYMSGELKLRAPDGSKVSPIVSIRNDAGEIYETSFRRARGTKLICFAPDDLPLPDIKISRIRISSNRPFRAEQVLWTTYSLRDMK